MLKRRIVVVVAILLVSMLGICHAQEKHPNRGLLMWAAFSCATFAELSGNSGEQERLFKLGYKIGRELLSDIDAKKIDQREFENLPVGVKFRLAGPTTEFIMGRIFEGAQEDAFDKVVKEDDHGGILTDPLKWADGELKVLRARNKFQKSNCGVLR